MTGPNGCPAAINIKGEHFWCVEPVGHSVPGAATVGSGHRNPDAQVVWTGAKAADPSSQEIHPEGLPEFSVPVYVYKPCPPEKLRPPVKPEFAGSRLGQREGGVDGYHEWQGFGVGWSDFIPHHSDEFYTEDEVGMPSIKNPMGTR